MKNNYLKTNFFFIIFFIIFLISFPTIKSWSNDNRSKEENNISTPNSFLAGINNTSDSFTGFFGNLRYYFVSRKSLLDEVDNLKNQIQKGEYLSLLGSTSTSENLINKNSPIPAKKIFADFTSIYDTILLNKGFLDGIEKGDLVFLYPDRLIGQIENINSNTSLLALYSRDKNKLEGVMKVTKGDASISINPIQIATTSSTSSVLGNTSSTSSSTTSENSNSTFKIQNSFSGGHNIIVDIYGRGGGDFSASLPDNIKVATGTIIYLASDESKALGEVVKIESEEASFYQTIFIRGYYNTRTNDNYYIIRK